MLYWLLCVFNVNKVIFPCFIHRENYQKKFECQNRQEDIDLVKKLDSWTPAKPIATTIPQLDPSEVKKY